jgi:hypothetical protein
MAIVRVFAVPPIRPAGPLIIGPAPAIRRRVPRWDVPRITSVERTADPQSDRRGRTHRRQSPSDPVTDVAPVYDPITGLLNNGVNLLSTGAVSPNRSQPKNAGFGMATGFQAPRTFQLTLRFSF